VRASRAGLLVLVGNVNGNGNGGGYGKVTEVKVGPEATQGRRRSRSSCRGCGCGCGCGWGRCGRGPRGRWWGRGAAELWSCGAVEGAGRVCGAGSGGEGEGESESEGMGGGKHEMVVGAALGRDRARPIRWPETQILFAIWHRRRRRHRHRQCEEYTKIPSVEGGGGDWPEC
jgi:hypothetical protein